MNQVKCFTFILIILFNCFLISCSTMRADSEEQQQNKKIAAINVKLGMAYLEKGDMQRAKQKLLYALQKMPQLPEALYSMAYFQEMTGNKAEAKKYYLKALSVGSQRGDVQNNYGTFLCRNGYYQEAISHFLLATQDIQYLDAASAYENAGLCALKIPDKKQAISYFNSTLEQDPTRETAMTELTKLRA